MNFNSDTTLEGVKSQPARLAFHELVWRFVPIIFFGICFLACWILRASTPNKSVADLVFLISASLVTLFVVSQQLSLQNAVGITLIIAIFSGATLIVEHFFDRPFSPPVFNKSFAQFSAWTSPLLWILAFVNARGIAKLFLYRFRKTENYGLGLIAFSSLLVTSFNLRIGLRAETLLIHFAVSAIALVALTPWFLDKKRVERKLDFQPVLIVILLFCW